MTAIYNCDVVVKGGIIKAGVPVSLTEGKHKQLIEAGVKAEIMPDDPPVGVTEKKPKAEPETTKKVTQKNIKKTKNS
jgi:hypothetical protein